MWCVESKQTSGKKLMKFDWDIQLHGFGANELFSPLRFYLIFPCSIVVDATLETFFFLMAVLNSLPSTLPLLTVLMYAIVHDDCFEYWTDEKKLWSQSNNWSSPLRLLISLRPSTFNFSFMWLTSCDVFGQKKKLHHHRMWFCRASFLELVHVTCAAF